MCILVKLVWLVISTGEDIVILVQRLCVLSTTFMELWWRKKLDPDLQAIELMLVS